MGDLALKAFQKFGFKIKKNLTVFHPILIKSRSFFLSEKKLMTLQLYITEYPHKSQE